LSVWPGYITAVDVFEGGLQLQLDVAHRVLRTETVRDVFVSLRKKSTGSLKEDAEKALLGSSIITRYNNKTYRIDGIDFDESPKSTFTLSTGETVTFIEYYKRQYGIKVNDPDQPLLINRPKIRGDAENQAERLIKLIPELCLMTGLTDAMKADFRIMKEVGNHTRLNPAQRQVCNSHPVQAYI
jgi:aubergine-like protein